MTHPMVEEYETSLRGWAKAVTNQNPSKSVMYGRRMTKAAEQLARLGYIREVLPLTRDPDPAVRYGAAGVIRRYGVDAALAERVYLEVLANSDTPEFVRVMISMYLDDHRPTLAAAS